MKKLDRTCKYLDIPIFLFLSLGLMIYFFYADSKCFEQSFTFVIGIALANVDGEKIKRKFGVVSGIVLLAISLVMLGFKQWIRLFIPLQYLSVPDLIIKLTASLGILILTYYIWSNHKKWQMFKAMKITGIYSYEIYLVHGYALLLFDVISGRVAAMAAIILVSVVGTVILHGIVSKLNAKLKRVLGLSINSYANKNA